MKRFGNWLLAVNLTVIAAICVLNYFYQLRAFDFTLKCICSGLFAILGLINLGCAIGKKAENRRFYIWMAVGLLLAFLGDVLIGYDFVLGAGAFALGHVAFTVAYCYISWLHIIDGIAGGVIFVPSALILSILPVLNFDPPVLRLVCVLYALIISTMVGKAMGNFIRHRQLVTGTIALASILFFFSDLMLVLDRFGGKWSWTDHACMGTYYPALCLLALSMCLSVTKKKI